MHETKQHGMHSLVMSQFKGCWVNFQLFAEFLVIPEIAKAESSNTTT